MSAPLLAFPPHLHLTSILSTPFLCSSNCFGGRMAGLTSSALEPITICSPHFSQVPTGSGTPPSRWRDITQSLAPSNPAWELFDPPQSPPPLALPASLNLF